MNDPWERPVVQELPPAIGDQLARERADGVYLSRQRGGGVIAIHWKPGDRNALAQAIIDRVEGPMQLELRGHRYRIEPA